MLIIGLDLSLNSTGVCTYNTVTAACNTYTIAPKSSLSQEQKIDLIVDNVLAIHTDPDQDVAIFIEGYAFSMHSSSVTVLAELAGVVKYQLRINDNHYYVVPPTMLKKYITGKGTAKKEQMLLSIYKIWGVEFSNNDEADAYALMQFGREFMGVKDPVDRPLTNLLREKLHVVEVGSTRPFK